MPNDGSGFCPDVTFEDDEFKEDNKVLNDQGEGERELMDRIEPGIGSVFQENISLLHFSLHVTKHIYLISSYVTTFLGWWAGWWMCTLKLRLTQSGWVTMHFCLSGCFQRLRLKAPYPPLSRAGHVPQKKKKSEFTEQTLLYCRNFRQIQRNIFHRRFLALIKFISFT